MFGVNDQWDIQGFRDHVNYYIRQLLKNPVNATTDDYLNSHGWGNPKLLDALCNKAGILTKMENIKSSGNDGKDQFVIQYKVNDNPGDKITQMWHTMVKNQLNEDGATSCGAVMGGDAGSTNDGHYTTPLFGKPIRRTLCINEKQAKTLMKKLLDEATSSSSVGNFAYDVPAFGDKETLNHSHIMDDATENWD